MRSPFPGMDPYLEHPALWPDSHNSLIIAIADELTPEVAPRYYIGLGRRLYRLQLDDVLFVGHPDIAAMAHQPAPKPLAETGVLEVEVPMIDEVGENFLEIREVHTHRLVTILELLSPVNKLNNEGRQQYLQKRSNILLSQTNLVEIDLLRAGNPMPVVGQPVASDYRILVSRAWQRSRAQLEPFNLQQRIPLFPLPLLRQDDPPEVDLGAVLHALYERARFDLWLDYTQPPVPPLGEEDTAWAGELLSGLM
jgi:hypothetical protein